VKCYLLDTNIASAIWDELSQFHHDAKIFFSHLDKNDRIFISPIVIAEIKYGHKVHFNADEERRHTIEKNMQCYEVMNIDRHTTEPYSMLRAALFMKYANKNSRNKVKGSKYPESLVNRITSRELGIQENDIWNAAVAIQYDLIFVTEDRMRRLVEISHRLDIITWLASE